MGVLVRFDYSFGTCSLDGTDGGEWLEGSYEVPHLHCSSITCIKQLLPDLSNLFLNLSSGYGSYLTA